MVKISRVLHAGYLFEHAGSSLLFDPIFEVPFSRNCFPFPSVEFDRASIRQLRVDAIFISHFHDDHCSLESLDLLDRNTPVFMFCVHDEFFQLLRELGFKDVRSLVLGHPVTVGTFEIVPKKALDEDVDSIFHIRVNGLNVLNVVDSWIHPDTLKQLARTATWDLILWPFQTMRELEVLSPLRAEPATPGLLPEWSQALKLLTPRFIVPSSCQFRHEEWSWYNHALFPVTYREFEENITALLPETKVVRMNPGTSIQLSETAMTAAESLAWVMPIGNQNIDYDYRPQRTVPSSAEVARQFTPLSATQFAQVLDFCETGIAAKLRDSAAESSAQAEGAAETDSAYFQNEVYWRLAVYDHDGRVHDFYYRLRGSSVERLTTAPKKLSWLTEISAAKLSAALTQGESLTSMYLRINDMRFADDVEARIADADILEDPLIRCLFQTDVAAYQAVQLRQIRDRTQS